MTLDWKRAFGDIRQVLLTDWDPIPSCPPDEFDGYIPKILGLLRDGASTAEIAHYLGSLLDQNTPEDDNLRAAKRLKAVQLREIHD